MKDRVSITMLEGGIADVRLIRADKMNALDGAMFEGIVEAIKTLEATAGLRVVVLSGEGKAFCAGLDMASMAGGSGNDLSARTHGDANTPQQVAWGWRKLPVPVIAAVHGVAFGGGFQIMSGADIRIAHPESRMAIMELKWGLVPDMGGYALWRGLVRDDVLRLLTYTNAEFSGAEALSHGFATLLDADPLAKATAIAHEIANRNPHAQRGAKRLFASYLHASVDEILLEESIEQQAIIGTKNQIEAVLSQMAKRKGEFVDP